MAPPRGILVTGATGFLGQYVVRELVAKDWKVCGSGGAEKECAAFRTHPPTPRPQPTPSSSPQPVALVTPSSAPAAACLGIPLAVGDLVTGAGLAAAVEAAAREGGGLAAIINAAATSSPRVCEADPDAAKAANVPSRLIAALAAWWEAAGGGEGEGAPITPLFVQISTDQVYGGAAPPGGWPEDAPLAPVNAYGRTKVEAEAAIASAWPRAVALRCSVMVGAVTPLPHPVAGTRFLQFVDGVVGGGGDTGATFYEDEWRCFVAVGDVARIAVGEIAAAAAADAPARPPIINVGGPERMSRLAFARLVARVRGVPTTAVAAARAADAPPHGVASPADIAMDTSLAQRLGYRLTPMEDVVAACQPGE